MECAYFCCNLSEGAGKHLPSRDDDFLIATEKELSSLNFLALRFFSAFPNAQGHRLLEIKKVLFKWVKSPTGVYNP